MYKGAGAGDADAGPWHLALHLLRSSWVDECLRFDVPGVGWFGGGAAVMSLVKQPPAFESFFIDGRRGRSAIAGFPQLEACSSLLSACGRAGRWRRALQAFSGMCNWGPKPDIAVCGALLDSFAKAGLWALALWLLSRMSNATSPLPQPDIAAYTAAISACAAAFKWEQAVACVQQGMREQLVRVSVAAYNAAGLACERAVQVQPLLDLMADMGKERLQADSITYLVLTSALGKGQQWERALGEFQSLRCMTLRPSSNLANSAITACEKGDAWLSAMSVFRQLEDLRISPTIVSSSATITAAAAQQEWLPAVGLLEDMRSWQVRADTIAWNSVLDACDLSSQWKLACELLHEMSRAGRHIGILALLAAASASEGAGQPAALLPLLGQLKDSSRLELRAEAQKQRQKPNWILEAEPSSMSHLLETQELLMTHGAASSEFELAASATIFKPCVRSLQSLVGRLEKRQLPAAGSQLWQPVLERQFSLGRTSGFRRRAGSTEVVWR